MSSHDKRRCYVGTLESYVVWLEKEMKFFGGDPIAMKKIVKHKGMTCRSLRVGQYRPHPSSRWADHTFCRRCWLISKMKHTNFTSKSKPKRER